MQYIMVILCQTYHSRRHAKQVEGKAYSEEHIIQEAKGCGVYTTWVGVHTMVVSRT